MDAPKRIGLVYNGLGGWRLWDVNEPGMGGVDRPHAEYILAAEHDRILAEKTAEIERLREALKAFTGMEASISSDVSSAHNGRIGAAGWMVEDDRDFRRDLRNAFGAARAALGGDNANKS